jgi:IS5 family transposase
MVPHVAAKTQGSAVPERSRDGRLRGQPASQEDDRRSLWLGEEIGTLGRVMLRGLDRLRGEVLLNFSAYNLVRLGNLLAPSH